MTEEMRVTMRKINKISVRRSMGRIKNDIIASNHQYALELKLKRLAKEYYSQEVN